MTTEPKRGAGRPSLPKEEQSVGVMIYIKSSLKDLIDLKTSNRSKFFSVAALEKLGRDNRTESGQ